MKVREVLEPLKKNALERLCRRRSLNDRGSMSKLRTSLACSYRGDFSALVADLRREDLLRIASTCSDTADFPSGMHALRIQELRQVCLATFEGRRRASEEEEETGDDARTKTPSAGLNRGGQTAELYVTGPKAHGSWGGDHVDQQSLRRMAANADSVTIFSAYYVPEVLETIVGACRGSVKVILNGLGGNRLAEQKAELEELQSQLRKKSQRSEIRLAFSEGLFHTKLYLVSAAGDSVAWIGSANATRAGLNGRNEEVLVKLTPVPESVLDYVNYAWKQATPIDDCGETVNSLIAFFRTGTLYYKPYATLQMTLNPFRSLIERLPPQERQKISVFRSPFAEDEAGIGAFNLNLVFERSENREMRASSVPTHRVELRRQAVETCYGYWVAEPLRSQVDKMLESASDLKRHRLKSIRDWMREDGEAIVSAYSSYLQDVLEALEGQNVLWREYASPELFEDTTAVQRRMDFLLTVLDTKRLLNRHCQAFVSGEVPEIWEDDHACASFMDSFFESLANAQSGRRRSGTARRILESLQPSNDTPKAIRTALEAALESEDWYKSVFAEENSQRIQANSSNAHDWQ